jgi:hypothetical protein
MDDYQYYLTARVWIFKVFRTRLGRREYLLIRRIIQSRWWRLRWLLLLWWWWGYLLFPYLFGLWVWLWRSSFCFSRRFRFFIVPFIPSGLKLVLHNFYFVVSPSILRELILLMVGWSTSPPGTGLLRLLISSVTIKVTAYLFSMELEVDLSRSDVDDCIDSVEEWSS